MFAATEASKAEGGNDQDQQNLKEAPHNSVAWNMLTVSMHADVHAF